jgi:hypothetical protein
MIGQGATNRVGQALDGVMGRVAGAREGYRCSDAMVEAGASGLTWDIQTLEAFLADPKAMVKGNNGLHRTEEPEGPRRRGRLHRGERRRTEQWPAGRDVRWSRHCGIPRSRPDEPARPDRTSLEPAPPLGDGGASAYTPPP